MSLKRIFDSPAIMSWLNFISKIIGLLLLTPLILKHFTESEVVIWYSIISMISIGIMFDTGFLPTIVRFYAYSDLPLKNLLNDGEGGEEKSRDYIYIASKKVYEKLALIAFFAILTVGSIFLNKPFSTYEDSFYLWLSWVVVTICISAGIYGNIYVSQLQGNGLIAKNQKILAIFALLSTITASIFIISGASLYIVIVVYQLLSASSIFVNKYVVDNNCKSNSEGLNDVLTQIVIKKMWSVAWRSGLGIIFSVGLIYFSGIISANILTASESAMYLLSIQLVRAVSGFSFVPFYSALPRLNTMYANRHISELTKAIISIQSKCFSLYAFFCISYFIISPIVLEFINFDTDLPSNVFWLFLILGVMIERFGMINVQSYALTNNIIWHKINGTFAVFTIVIVALLIPSYGVMAFPCGYLFSSIFYYLFSTFYLIKVFDYSFLKSQIYLILLLLVVINLFYCILNMWS